LSVEDTGIGIHPEDMEHLFDRFYRGRDVSQSTKPGTGLGLSIVKEIVEQHQGTIEIGSELGHGTSFTISLPIAR
jgi:two-component system phosphate regulon sensor histidine kinase PhoR